MVIKTTSENIKTSLAILGIFIACVGSVLTFGGTWKNLPEQVKSNAKQIDQIKKRFWSCVRVA